MKVEIWSDVMCPFCYLGKHRYEQALAQFAERDYVITEWKSFQLDPTLPKEGLSTNTYTYLSERKGMSIDRARQMTEGLSAQAAAEGITLDFEKAIIANTFDAHRLTHLAKRQGFGNEIEEKLFEAHFVNGEDISDKVVLTTLGKSVGLKEDQIQEMFEKDQFKEEVKAEITEAAKLGIRGVPFFVFNRKYAVSGAQPQEVFLQTLEKAFAEWRKDNPVPAFTTVADGPVCDPESGCD